LGTRYSDAMGCTFLDKDGVEKPVIMGSYGIGSGRLMACIVEEHHDENGIIWPITVAPYQVHLVSLGTQTNPQIQLAADKLYDQLVASGFEVLYDDREESPGVKFMDADLIGIPIRITISERTLQKESVEFKRRDQAEKSLVPLSTIQEAIQTEISKLTAEIQAKVIEVPFEG